MNSPIFVFEASKKAALEYLAGQQYLLQICSFVRAFGFMTRAKNADRINPVQRLWIVIAPTPDYC